MWLNTSKVIGFCTAVAATTAAYVSYYQLSGPQDLTYDIPPTTTPYLNVTLNFNQYNLQQCPLGEASFEEEQNKIFHDWGFLLLNLLKDPVFIILKESNSAIYKLWFKSIADGVMQLGAHALTVLGFKYVGETLFLPGKIIKKPIEAKKSSTEEKSYESTEMQCLMQYLQDKAEKGEKIDLVCSENVILIRDPTAAKMIRKVQEQYVEAAENMIGHRHGHGHV